MRVRPNHARVNERRPLAGADVRGRFAHGAETAEEIRAVDRFDMQPWKRADEARDVATGGLEFHGDGNRVAVVLDQKQHRQVPQAGGVHSFPELAAARRTLAERDVHDFVGLEARLAIRNDSDATVNHAGFRGADRLQHLCGGGARLRDNIQIGLSPVRRHLPPVRIRVVFSADAGEEHVERRHAQLQAQRSIAIIRIEPVVTRLQREASRHENGFVACAADLEEDLALMFELNFLVVELPREQHRAIDGQQLVTG